MSNAPGPTRSVVMLTADRQIDRRILLEADSLEAAGWVVTIIAMPPDEAEAGGGNGRRIVRLDFEQATLKSGPWILQVYRRIRQRIPMNGSLMRAIKQIAWRWFLDQESFFTSLFSETAFRYSPSVFVAHDLPMLPVARLAAGRCGAKLVYDSHELYSEQLFSNWERARWAQIEAKHVGACDLVITVNPSIAGELESRYGLRDVKVIYNAERCSQAPSRARTFHSKLGLRADSQVLLLQGGLLDGRNLETLVASMRLVRNERVVLVVLGNGSLLKRLKAIVASENLGRRVFFLPAVPQEDLIGLTAAADAGVIPYLGTCLNNRYATPNKLFEFIAAGLPVLASDLPELRRIVAGFDIGLVGDARTPASLAALIDDFFGDRERLAAWRGRMADVRRQLSWEQEEIKLVRMYEALCPVTPACPAAPAASVAQAS